MQLILESEPTLTMEIDMSTIEDIQHEKVSNGEIKDLNDGNCNGNKENVGDFNVIPVDAVNIQSSYEVEGVLNDSLICINSENNDIEPSIMNVTKENECVVNSPELDDAQIVESEYNGTDEEINSINVIDKDIENKPEETVQENKSEEIVQENNLEGKDDIIVSQKINSDGILDIVKNQTENAVIKYDEIEHQTANDVKNDEIENQTANDVKNDEIENQTANDVKNDEIENQTSDDVKNDEIENQTTNDVKNDEIKNQTANNVKNDKIESQTANDVKNDEIKYQTVNEMKNDEIENQPEIVVKNDETTLEEELLSGKDNFEVFDESTETVMCKTAMDVELEVNMNQTESTENKDKQLDDCRNVVETTVLDCSSAEVISNNELNNSSPIELKDDMEVEEVVEESKNSEDKISQVSNTAPVNTVRENPIICKLSNTLDILSDDEEELPTEKPPQEVDTNEKQCINIEDDDDIMLIDENTNKTDKPLDIDINNIEESPAKANNNTDSETGEKTIEGTNDLFAKNECTESIPTADTNDARLQIDISEKQDETNKINTVEPEIPLLPDNFLKASKKNLADMTREDLEEFCILKIVESIVDRSNLSEIKNKLKTMAQGIEEYRKKAMMLTKQNRDLQVVLKSVQEEQKKKAPDAPITPLKITRSVGMQVFMEKSGARRKSLAQLNNAGNNNLTNRQNARNVPAQSPRPQKPPASNQPIPVPRLVPANSPAMKTPSTIPLVNQITPTKTTSPMSNGIKQPSPSQKVKAEKRQHNRIMSVTVDLTDDEPPVKINNRTSPIPPVRLVPSQNLMANPRQQFASSVNSPRKVYIPISGPQNPGLRPGQTIMLKPVPPPALRQRCPTPQMARVTQGAVRMSRIQPETHPASLPEAMKQYEPPNWKGLPPAPCLKLSKVEHGIVLSWKIEGYQEDSHEEIASYQLYAYQETTSPPSTGLWKKIGDVKALPLPMACTLTQFMAGFRYYFAVRAVDIRSRFGPFSQPGSIVLLQKM